MAHGLNVQECEDMRDINKPLEPFKFWAQKVLPLVYDDSLSYYEVLCKVVEYLNETIDNVDNMHTEVTGLHEAYVQLQNYVNTYFDNLDVQSEINAKLDEMASDGTLSAIILPLIPPAVTDWLDDNITPTSPPIDSTLTVSGAAADAKKTGDEITNLKYCNYDTIGMSEILSTQVRSDVVDSYTKMSGNFINGAAWRINGNPASGSNYCYTVYTIPASYRKAFLIISGHSWGNNYPLVSFYDDSDNLLCFYGNYSRSTAYINRIVVVPDTCSKMIINGDARESSYQAPLSTTAWNTETLTKNLYPSVKSFNTLITPEYISNHPTFEYVRNWEGGYCYPVGNTTYSYIKDIPIDVDRYFSLIKLTTSFTRSTNGYSTYILLNNASVWFGWDNGDRIYWQKINNIPPSPSINCGLEYIQPTSTINGKAIHTNGNEAENSIYLYNEYEIEEGETYLVTGYSYSTNANGGYSAYIIYDSDNNVIDFGNFGTTGVIVRQYVVTAPKGAVKMNINGNKGGGYTLPSLQRISSSFNLNNVYQVTKPRKYLFIGDSYCEGYSHDGNNSGWAQYCAEYMGLDSNDYVRSYYGGARFSANSANNTYLARLTAIQYPFDYFTDIVVCGGYNDNSYSTSDIVTGIRDFVTMAKKMYPNARIHVGFIAWNKAGTGDGAIDGWQEIHTNLINTVLPSYHKCTEYGVSYMTNVEYWLNDSLMTNSDGYHPSEAGNRSIARAVANALLTGSAPLPYNGDLRLS